MILDRSILDECIAAIDPYVVSELSELEWRMHVAQLERKLRRKVHPIRRFLPSWRRRTVAVVKDIYEEKWEHCDLEQRYGMHEKPVLVAFRGRRLLVRPRGLQRVHLAILHRLIEKLRPSTVLEVGSGLGVNTLLLGRAFPDGKFTGLELTEAGARCADTLIRQALPPILRQYCPFPIDSTFQGSVPVFHQASAAETMYTAGQFNLVYSMQALEQMNDIKSAVVRELHRICAGYLILFEPFREFNQDPLRRQGIAARGYLNASVEDLVAAGFEILEQWELPTKHHYGIGLVICGRASRSWQQAGASDG